jgi:hypothetical protein
MWQGRRFLQLRKLWRYFLTEPLDRALVLKSDLEVAYSKLNEWAQLLNCISGALLSCFRPVRFQQKVVSIVKEQVVDITLIHHGCRWYARSLETLLQS